MLILKSNSLKISDIAGSKTRRWIVSKFSTVCHYIFC